MFFSSDNGPHREGGNDPDFNDSNGPLRGIKRDLTEGGIRVPFIARWPGHIKAGTTSDFVGGFQDVMPTLAELAGAAADVPKDIDGLSIAPTLLGQAAISSSTTISTGPSTSGAARKPPAQAAGKPSSSRTIRRCGSMI